MESHPGLTPAAAFGIAAGPHKRDKLLALANNGYILLDLFPFAINYTTPFRTRLNNTGVSVAFFNSYLLANLVPSLLLSACPILAFSGPPTIHHYLAYNIASGLIGLPAPIICRSVPNFFVPPPPPLPIPLAPRPGLPVPLNHLPWPAGSLLNGIYPNPAALNRAPYYRCCCYDGANFGPHKLFINNAFI